MNEGYKIVGLVLAILSPLGAAAYLSGSIERAETDVLHRIETAANEIAENRESDANQWRQITENRVLAARLDERSRCR